MSNGLASSSRGSAAASFAEQDDDGLGQKSDHADLLPRISLDAPENVKISGTLQKKPSVTHRLLDDPKLLFWRRSGIVFVPPIRYSADLGAQTGIGQEATLKEDTLLCKHTVSAHSGADQPVRYKASREARYDALRESWRQQQVTLTSEYLSIYSSPALAWPVKRLEHQIPLQKAKDLKLSLVSPLDYSFSLRYATKSREEYITFTFRARSVIECKMWYLALYKILPTTAKQTCSPFCEVNIPFLGVQVHLPLAAAASSDEGIRYDITLDDVRDATLAVLRKEGGWDTSKQRTLMREDLDICWRRENRIEWVYWRNSYRDGLRTDLVVGPQLIEQTHRLEILPKEHTPSDVILHDNTVLEEPPAVEGPLWRLTNFHGKRILSNPRAKRKYYFASFNQFLFYIPRTQAHPPNVDKSQDSEWLHVITSFKPGSAELLQDEVDRRMNLLRHATGVIDMTQVSYVRRAFEANEEDDEDLSYEDLAEETSQLLRSTRQRYTHEGRARIEMMMQDGLVIKLQAATNEACEEWVHRLAKLTVYWRAHAEAERDAHSQDNFSHTLASDYLMEEEKGQRAENVRVDTRIWSYCCYDRCRDIVKTGTMYFQPRSRGTFTKKIFILTLDGCLLYYNKYDRSAVDCQPTSTAGHDRKSFLEIADCYVFSEHPDAIGLADIPRYRIFGDGLATADSGDDCIFSLWKPQSRRVYSPSRKRFTVYKDSKRFFASEGELWLFLAKSKQEKEEWVWAINVVIEHLLRSRNQHHST